MNKFYCAVIAVFVISSSFFVLALDELTVKSVKQPNANTNTVLVLDSEFAKPAILDSVYVFVPPYLVTGAFTNYCLIRHKVSSSSSTNNAGMTIVSTATSSQSVHAVYIKALDLKVMEGDSLYVSNSMANTETRLFFK